IRQGAENAEVITIEGAVFGKPYVADKTIQIPDSPIRMNLPFYPGMTVISALDLVGGPTPLTGKEDGYIIKKGNGEKIDIKTVELWKSRNKNLDVELSAGDYIFIPMQNSYVFITGEVTRPGAYGYANGRTVWDYILMAGGINENTADTKGIYFLDEKKKKTKVDSTTSVKPGTHIYVGKKILFESDQFLRNVFITTGWITAVISIVNVVWDIIDRIQAHAK
ncbi:MAG: SLBB domain-containing protein, partial [Spirochaetota bacterium]